MTFAKGYELTMGILIRAQVTILAFALGATAWLINQAFTTVSPERIEGLSELFKMSCTTAIYASCGIIGTYLFRSAGFEPRNGYRPWFFERALQKPWYFTLDRWAAKTLGILLIAIVVFNLLRALVYPFVLLRFAPEIFQWLQSTAI